MENSPIAMRSLFRKIAIWLAVGSIGAVLFGVIGEFAVKLVEAWGLFDDIERRYEQAVSTIFDILTSFVATHIAALSLGLLIGSYLDSYLKKKSTEPESPTDLEEFRGTTFLNETLDLDGKSFVNCYFQFVKFRYSGGPCALVGCTFHGKPVISPQTPETERLIKLLYEMGHLSTTIAGANGPVVQSTKHEGPEDERT